MTDIHADRAIYSVSQLNAEVAELLSRGLGRVWVAGELSNLAQPRSGHWYFSLKDAEAQVRCAMFRNSNRLVRRPPAEGDQVLIRARVGLYAPRGDYQLVAEHMEPAGEGALRLAFEQLKAKLQAEGLFDEARKQAVPEAPARVAVVTSPTGAAIRDIQSVIARRSPLTQVTVLPVPVQGDAAAPAIATAIAHADMCGFDVLVVGRGGGSLEDLWPFNDEAVARAIAACKTPVVSAVGHEVDWSIADWVADQRAPTPSAAAELVTQDLFARVQHAQQALQRAAQSVVRARRLLAGQTASFVARLQAAHPGRQLEVRAQTLDDRTARLLRAAQYLQRRRQQSLQPLAARLGVQSPARQIAKQRTQLNNAREGLVRTANNQQKQLRAQLGTAAQTLHAYSPLATLERGYAIALDESGTAVRDADELQQGQTLDLRLGSGQAQVEVLSTAVPVDGGHR
ncbi:exodeoxyribonuclease VII large subunit [bacterium]|nr:exodeoxyribonuclease VII large subunit [bacterium]